MGALSARGDTDIITAYAGGGQALATRITKRNTIVNTSAAPLASVKLPPAMSEDSTPYEIVNLGLNTINIYPNEGNYINGSLVNIPLALMKNQRVTFRCYKGENGIFRK